MTPKRCGGTYRANYEVQKTLLSRVKQIRTAGEAGQDNWQISSQAKKKKAQHLEKCSEKHCRMYSPLRKQPQGHRNNPAPWDWKAIMPRLIHARPPHLAGTNMGVELPLKSRLLSDSLSSRS